MEVIIARILGIYFVAVSIALIFSPERVKRIHRQMIENEPHLFFAGILAIFFGAWIITVHNIWVLGWPLILTIIGWISLIKGIALIAFPGFPLLFGFIYERSSNVFRILGLIWAVIGGLLIYYSCQ